MAALQALRNGKMGIIIMIFIALALLSFILTDLLGKNNLFSTTDEIGQIAGETVKIQEYQQKIEETEAFVKISQGSASINEDLQNRIREDVWRQMIAEKTFSKVYENAGIDVTADELLDMVVGNHISPALRPLFTNPQTNSYDRQLAENFLRNKNQNPQAAFFWSFQEKSLKQDRLYNKYITLLRKSLYYPQAQAQVDAEKQAKEIEIAFVGVRYNAIPDSTIEVSNSEIKQRFEKNKELYKVDETRDIEYVAFPIKPTELDEQETSEVLAELKEDFASAETDAYRFAQQNSDASVVERWVSKEQLDKILVSFVETAQAGEVYGPYRSGDTYKISRLVAVEQRPDSVKARHILIREDAELADSLYNALKNGADFAAAARKYSEDPGSAINGGDLDWFPEGVMTQTFNDACFSGKKGDIVKIQSPFGTHIINIQDKGVANTKYSVATIEKTIQFSSRTQQEVFGKANAFAIVAKDKQQFEAQIDSLNLVKRYGNAIRKNANSINTLRSAREIVKWAYKANVGDVSDVFKTDDQFVVAVLVKEQEKGYSDVKELEPILSREIRNEKKADIIAKAAAGKSLSEIAELYNAKVDTANHITFTSNVISGAGNEPKLVGAVVATKKGDRVEALKGNNAVYVAEVTSVDSKEADLEAAKVAYMQQFQNFNLQVSSFVADVDIEDNRIKFY